MIQRGLCCLSSRLSMTGWCFPCDCSCFVSRGKCSPREVAARGSPSGRSMVHESCLLCISPAITMVAAVERAFPFWKPSLSTPQRYISPRRRPHVVPSHVLSPPRELIYRHPARLIPNLLSRASLFSPFIQLLTYRSSSFIALCSLVSPYFPPVSDWWCQKIHLSAPTTWIIYLLETPTVHRNLFISPAVSHIAVYIVQPLPIPRCDKLKQCRPACPHPEI